MKSEASHDSESPETPLGDLHSRIQKIDQMLANPPREDSLKIVALSIRLALGMAEEMQSGLPIGSQTAPLVSQWNQSYGSELIESVVEMARDFLLHPDKLKSAMKQKIEPQNADTTKPESRKQ